MKITVNSLKPLLLYSQTYAKEITSENKRHAIH